MSNFKKWFKTNVISLLPALLLVLVIRSSFLEAFKIPSGSMTPTLLVGDRLFVNKLAYGLRVPFVEWFADDPMYFFRTSEPSRGDIIVFKSPEDADIYLIKRIIAVPGDTIEMRNKTIYINNKEMARNSVPENKIPELFESMKDFESEYPADRMKIFYDQFDKTTGTIMLDAQNNYSLNFPSVRVPQGSYFVMGDNRDNSKDSRYIGFIPFENIKGKAVIVWLNLWIDFEQSQFIFHPGRIGSLIH